MAIFRVDSKPLITAIEATSAATPKIKPKSDNGADPPNKVLRDIKSRHEIQAKELFTKDSPQHLAFEFVI
ncbi:hypothetical protein D3C87_1728880 [compost metagenome]